MGSRGLYDIPFAIIAAADYAREVEGVTPPRELILSLHCERYHALPKAGGLLDQPAGLIGKMGTLKNVFDAHKLLHDARGQAKATFWKDYPDAGKVIRQVDEMRRTNG